VKTPQMKIPDPDLMVLFEPLVNHEPYGAKLVGLGKRLDYAGCPA